MTEAMALTGQWDGLRAYPRGFRAPSARRRLETALERLQHHHDRFARHAARASLALSHIEGLRSGMIDQLDAIDAPLADLEPNGDDEPSLCGVAVGGAFVGTDDLEDSADDNGEPALGAHEGDYGTDWSGPSVHEDEPSLAATLALDQRLSWTAWAARTAPGAWMATWDREDQCDDEGHDSDREPAEHG